MYHLKKLIIILFALTLFASQFPRSEGFDTWFRYALSELLNPSRTQPKASESDIPAEHLSSPTPSGFSTSDKLQNAIDKAKTALHSHPESYELHYHLGMLYTHQRSFKSAIAEYQEAIKLAGHVFASQIRVSSEVAILYTALGSVYSKLNFQKEAIESLGKSIQLDFNQPKAHYNLGYLYSQQGKWDLATNHLKRAIELDPNFVEAFYQLGLGALRQNKFENAIEYFQRTIELQPEFSKAYYNLGKAYTRLKNRNAAENAFAKFKELSSREKQLKLYEGLVELNPDVPELLVSLAAVYTQQGRLDDAVEGYRRAIQLNKNLAEAHAGLGFVLTRQHKLEQAAEEYRNVIQLQPNYAEAHAGLGLIELRQGKYSQAAKHYEKSVQLKPQFAEAHHNLGLIYSRQGKIEEAIAEFKQALTLNPEAAATFYGLANAYKQLGKVDEAIEFYEQAIHNKSDLAPALDELARLYAKRGIKLDVALQYAKLAVEQDSKNARYHATIAGVYFARQDYVAAEAAILQALKYDPNNPTYQKNLAAVQLMISKGK